jgi:hypothetical protein
MPEINTQTAEPEKTKYPSQSPAKQREYYLRFYEKKSQIGQTVCPICLGHYTYFNKSHHNKGLHHQRALALAERIKQMKADAEGKAKYKTLDTLLTFQDIQNLPECLSTCSSIC